ncbi:MAG TPA: hypothetical protein VGE07_15730 [Herpetosiphonaceae bacterium]
MEAVVLILNDVDLLHEVLRAWEEIGVNGVTVLRSTGLGRITDALYRDDAPLFPSLREVLEGDERHHWTLLSVMEPGLVDPLIAATERITGPLSEPNTGMLFTLPVGKVIGGYRG